MRAISRRFRYPHQRIAAFKSGFFVDSVVGSDLLMRRMKGTADLVDGWRYLFGMPDAWRFGGWL
jgi:hypothetical protein